MKVSVSKKVKGFILIGLSCLIVLLGSLAFKVYNHQEILVNEVPIYECTTNVVIEDYVYLKPNPLYEEQKLVDYDTYLTEFIEKMGIKFKVDFNGNKESSISGDYQITAKVRGYQQKSDEKLTVWEKDYLLKPQQKFEEITSAIHLEEGVGIDFNQFNTFAKQVQEAAKISIPIELIVSLEGSLLTSLEEGQVTEPLLASVVIPLNQTYFSIQKNSIVDKKNDIKEQQEVIVPMNTKLFTTYIALIGLCILVGGFVTVFTQPPTKAEEKRKQIENLLRIHGSRMVAVDKVDEINYTEIYNVTHLQDLIKIADELEQPILYIYNRDIMKITKFYIRTDALLYVYELRNEGNIRKIEENTLVADINEMSEEL